MTPMTRRALYLQDAHPIRDAIAYTQYAEEKGFEAVWQADSRLAREAGVPMAAPSEVRRLASPDTCANPKSMILARRCWSIMMLDGLISQ